MNISVLIEKFNKKHNNKYNYSLVEYINNRTKIKIIYPIHGIFEQIPENHKKQGCPKCARNKILSKEQFIERSNKIHNNKYDYSLVEYINIHTKVKILCPEHGEFLQEPKSHMSGCGCSFCDDNKRKTNIKDFIKKSQEIHSNKYDYSLVKYINNHTKIKIIYPQHGIFTQTPYKHMNRKQGCPSCNGGIKFNTEIFISKSKDIHGEKYDYSSVNYINSSTKVEIICKIHGIFKQIPNNHISKKYGCPYCNESHGEKEICKILNNNNINYIRQYKFNNCRHILPLPFDFYIPDFNLCIEFDGEQHFRIFEKWGGEENLLNIKRNDEIKNQFCKNNNIEILRIKYNENIKDLLSKKFETF